ncbi:tetratricopeptide repeat-containing sulfotransferase family protein [Limnoraphis robusta]|uniref:tetratricopeptide repeat-containing sulfotransferase family protein n=1 Tax=Limnoraphis robusta TaxID=1118279 RepID=UPI002B213946|nr:sulfotransferase [Limnoraphis robusta]MEA5497928.1 sulfotransferase [Limnoraphis robusta BA-68 BA1]
MNVGELIRNANRLKREGKLDEAIALYHQVIEINPHFSWAYSNLGDALVQQNYLDYAIDCFDQAIKINSGISFFYYQLSEVLAIQGRFNKALVCFDHFLKIDGTIEKLKLYHTIGDYSDNFIHQKTIQKSAIWKALKAALFLDKNDKINEALNVYQKIIEDSHYQYSEVYNKVGELFLKIGERKKAVANFEKAIFLNPDIAQYHLNLGEAIERWSLSVRSYRTAVKLNPMVLKDYYDQVEFVNTQDIKVKNPIFVVGCGHSGTSLMLALLGSHPSVYPIPYESAIFLQSMSKIEETMRGWDEKCLAEQKKRWIEKTPPHIFQIGKFLKIRPHSQFILMLRDGRDVVCSLKHRPDSNYQKLMERIERWIYDNLAAVPYWDHPQVHVVKYEDLVTHPQQTLKKVFDFLGEEYNDKILEFYKTERRWYSLEVVKPEAIDSVTAHKQHRNWQINQPLFDGRGRWREEMTEGEKIIFKKKAQQYLVKFGYVEDENW